MSLLAVACLKLVELRAGVDPLTGAVVADPASAGPSPADEAALEWALRLATSAGGRAVAVSAGDTRCEGMLRDAVAAGATEGLRVELDPAASSARVALALALAVRHLAGMPDATAPEGGPPGGVSGTPAVAGVPVLVCCGDASVDRGSGSVPAFLAAELGAAQALGLVAVRPASPGDCGETGAALVLEVERRLDKGRRERLALRPPCVISVEAVSGRLRRASLVRTLAAREAAVSVLDPSGCSSGAGGATAGRAGAEAEEVELVRTAPFRPRTREVPPPPGSSARARIAELTGSLHERPAARTLTLGPDEAADELLATLAAWGELPESLLTTTRPQPEGTEDP